MNTHRNDRYLVIGATGKTGRRVAEKLRGKGLSVRAVSRSTGIVFDWNNQSTWAAALDGITSAYVTYQPDLALPGAVDVIRAFLSTAKKVGVNHVVLLSGRGEEEAEAAEQVLQTSGLDWTVLRASWFMQNFSENYMRDELLLGSLTLPVGPTKEPFIDADDIAAFVLQIDILCRIGRLFGQGHGKTPRRLGVAHTYQPHRIETNQSL